MKVFPTLTGLLLLLTTGAGVAQSGSEEPSGMETLNRIVAIINNDVIMRSELDDEIIEITAQLREKDTPLPSQRVLEKQVLERLIYERLQLQLADNNGIRIDDSMLNDELKDLARQNGLSLTEFRNVLEREGYEYETFREDVRNQIIINRLRQQLVASRIKVSDQEVENLLASVEASQQGDVSFHLAHILVAIPEAASPEEIQAAQVHAGDILASLQAGADFTQTAIAESDAPTALEGGDIGWRSIGQVPSLFVDTLKTMQPGDISDLIRSPGGFHIVKLLEKRGGERHFITQTLARHILIKPDAILSDKAAELRLEQLRERIIGGEDFATLARSNSQDTLSAAKGGSLGWVSPGELVPEFEEVMNKLQPGQLSEPFKTQFGWHLVKVLERREHDNTQDYLNSRARQLIRSRKMDEETLLWLRRLRDESYVEYRLDT